jgi:hypothetical protein
LILEVWKDGQVMAQAALHLSLSPVEQMFRHKNLIAGPDPHRPEKRDGPRDRVRDTDVPNEPESNGKHFVFVHGYNVNATQARGWQAELFKRLYWSGSRARFYGVTWRGYQSQFKTITPNYHANVTNAFGHAGRLADFLNGLGGETVVAAHSLGNMVVASAIQDGNARITKYFMINAAVAQEAYDSASPLNRFMVHQDWFKSGRPDSANYPERLWASEWHQFYSPASGYANDSRFTLTWRGRFANVAAADVYNFYSSGEEVLATHADDAPTVLGVLDRQLTELLRGALPAEFVWALQEKLKGRTETGTIIGSSYGGWGFNPLRLVPPGRLQTPAEANTLLDSALRETPFFGTFSLRPEFAEYRLPPALFGNDATGSRQVTTDARARWLAQAFPARTPPAGANTIQTLERPGPARNLNMDTVFKNGWPSSRIIDEFRRDRWLHSDIRVVSYVFVHGVFERFVDLGSLR